MQVPVMLVLPKLALFSLPLKYIDEPCTVCCNQCFGVMIIQCNLQVELVSMPGASSCFLLYCLYDVEYNLHNIHCREPLLLIFYSVQRHSCLH